MNKSILSLTILSSLSFNAFSQDNSVPKFNQDFKVSAVIEPGCFLTAENINFGVLQMPIQDQSTQSNINIRCSKAANLELSIDYSNSSNSGTSSSYEVIGTLNHTRDFSYTNYKIYVDGQPLSNNVRDFMCSAFRPNDGRNYIGGGREYVDSKELANILQSSLGYQSNLGLCSLGSNSNMSFNTSFLDNFFGTSGSGVLVGLSSNEQIKYFLEKPTDNSKIWNSNNKYQLVGTGDNQVIPMKANIKRADNPTYRMTPDTYQSTLTVVLTY